MYSTILRLVWTLVSPKQALTGKGEVVVSSDVAYDPLALAGGWTSAHCAHLPYTSNSGARAWCVFILLFLQIYTCSWAKQFWPRTTCRPITSKDNSSTRTVRYLFVMDAPVEEALPRANAHIARYHHLLALVQAERFFEPVGASVEAKEWLAWAHFVRWVLVGYVQPRSSMLLTLPVALPLRIVLDRCFGSSWLAALSIHVPDRRSHDEPHRSRLRGRKRYSWPRRSLRSSCPGTRCSFPSQSSSLPPRCLSRIRQASPPSLSTSKTFANCPVRLTSFVPHSVRFERRFDRRLEIFRNTFARCTTALIILS